MSALSHLTYGQLRLVLLRSLKHVGSKGPLIYLMPFYLIFCCALYSSLLRAQSQTVNLILLDWTSQRVLTFVLGNALKGEGVKVDYITVTVEQLPGILARGLGHIQIEHWNTDFKHEFKSMMDNGLVVSRGEHATGGREEWWYPLYVKELCPGLPDWRALKHCAGLFAEADSEGNGVFWTGNWHSNNAELIRALELDFIIRRVDSGKILWQKLYGAAKQKAPIMVFNWQPNWTNSRLPGEFVNFPEYQAECESDPSWGISATIAYDCGNPLNTDIIKLAWPGLGLLSPCADKLLAQMTFNSLMIADAAAFSDIDGLSEQQAALKWSQKYQNELKQWTAASCRE